MTSSRPYLVRAIYDWILDNQLTPHVVVDATAAGVSVPPAAVRDGQVVLNIAPRAVAQLELGNEHVRFLARFGGVSHDVRVPIAAVLAVYAQENGQGMMFPAEVAAPAPASLAPVLSEGVSAIDAVPSGPAPDDAGEPRRGRPSLRIVK